MNTLRSILKRFSLGTHIDPVRDWLILLTFCAFVLISLIVWNAWAFDTVASGGNIGDPAPKHLPVFNPAALDTVRDIFETRALEEAKYVTGVYRYADPSQ